MREFRASGWVVTAVMVLWWAGAAMAAPPPHPPKPADAQKCEAKKNEAAGEKAECLARERAKEVKGKTPDYAKCEEKFAEAFAKAEQEAGPGGCPTEGDTAAIEGQVDACMAGVAAALGGDNCGSVCGCGYNAMPNTNCVGCTFCLQAGAGPVPDCQFFCLAPPTCLCGGNADCCAANPCCDDCPGQKPAECFVNTCSCEPGACCFTVPAP